MVHDVTPAVRSVLDRDPAANPGDPFVANLDGVRRALAAQPGGGDGVPLTAVRLLSPVLSPTKIIGAPVNYHEHTREAAADAGINAGHIVPKIDEAGLFLKATTSLAGAGEGIALRFPGRRTDHEVEIGVVIGAICSRVRVADALSYVAGYAIALDITVRGTEDRSFRKSPDTYSVLGPYLVTADEVPDPGNLDLSLYVNAELRQASNSRHLIKDIPSLIAWASDWYTLYPGDIIMTGTPGGVGPIGPDDVLEAQADLLGSMTVHVRNGDEDA
jgi:2-keto-4-pentenoate hydratase/2-oxohepta-3-ene-1,7-dioic acid hydratase in catechol pathway